MCVIVLWLTGHQWTYILTVTLFTTSQGLHHLKFTGVERTLISPAESFFKIVFFPGISALSDLRTL